MTTLDALVAEAQEVVHALDELNQAIQAARHETEELHGGMTQTLAGINQEVHHAAEALNHWQQQATDSAHLLQPIGESLQHSATDTVTALEGLESEVKRQFADLQTAVTHINQVGASLRDGMEHVLESLQSGLDSAVEHAVATEGSLLQQFAQCEQGLAEVERGMTSNRAAVDSLVRNATGVVEQVEQDMSATTQELVQGVERQAIGAHVQAMEQLIQDVAAQTQEVAQQATHALESDVEHQLDQMIADVAHRLEALNQEISGTTDDSEHKRGPLGPLTQQVDGMLDPLRQLVDNVMQIANTVGHAV